MRDETTRGLMQGGASISSGAKARTDPHRRKPIVVNIVPMPRTE
jgi:hypothetical protein